MYLSGYHLESIELLEDIVQTSPQRTVAHLNLADAYWATNIELYKKRAIKSYKEYQRQMTIKERAHLIPKYVLTRINEF